MSDHYDLGDLVNLTVSFQTGSAYVDPSTIQLKVEDPDGLLSTFVYGSGGIMKLSTGHYFYNLFANKRGQWWYRWYSSGTVTQADEDHIIVDPSEIV
jgi:hypothetical protein